MNKKCYCIKVNPGSSKAIQLALFEVGYVWGSTYTNKVNHTGSPYLWVYPGAEPFASRTKIVRHSASNSPVSGYEAQTCSVSTFLQMIYDGKLDKREISVTLNPSYSALVTDNKITVGCQSFSFETFDKLAKVVNSFRQ